MNTRELESVLQALVGEPVKSKTIAGNSMLLWFGVEPKAPTAKCLCIEPPWRIETALGVESSSDGFPHTKDEGETAERYRIRFERACANSDVLEGSVLSSLAVDHLTSDLTLQFDDGRTLRAFSTNLEYENWHFTDHASSKRYGVSITGVGVEEVDA